jgi:hypothetical protein
LSEPVFDFCKISLDKIPSQKVQARKRKRSSFLNIFLGLMKMRGKKFGTISRSIEGADLHIL